MRHASTGTPESQSATSEPCTLLSQTVATLLAELELQVHYLAAASQQSKHCSQGTAACTAGGVPIVKSEPGRGPPGSAGFAPGAVRPNFVGKPFRPAGSQAPLSVGPAANYRPAKLKARADTVYKVGLPECMLCTAAAVQPAHLSAAAASEVHPAN